jgi:hypothetical protein
MGTNLAALAASGITPEHAEARGYETITDKRRLAELRISPTRRSVPGLLVPMLDIRGSTWGYQYRPDKARTDRKGKQRANTRHLSVSAMESTYRQAWQPVSATPRFRCGSPKVAKKPIVVC